MNFMDGVKGLIGFFRLKKDNNNCPLCGRFQEKYDEDGEPAVCQWCRAKETRKKVLNKKKREMRKIEKQNLKAEQEAKKTQDTVDKIFDTMVEKQDL